MTTHPRQSTDFTLPPLVPTNWGSHRIVQIYETMTMSTVRLELIQMCRVPRRITGWQRMRRRSVQSVSCQTLVAILVLCLVGAPVWATPMCKVMATCPQQQPPAQLDEHTSCCSAETSAKHDTSRKVEDTRPECCCEITAPADPTPKRPMDTSQGLEQPLKLLPIAPCLSATLNTADDLLAPPHDDDSSGRLPGACSRTLLSLGCMLTT